MWVARGLLLMGWLAAPQIWGAGDGLPFVRVASDRCGFELHGGRREVRSGRRALQVTVERCGDSSLSTPANFAEVGQAVKLTPGKTPLRASAWWRGRLEEGGEIRLVLVFRDARQREVASAKARAGFVASVVLWIVISSNNLWAGAFPRADSCLKTISFLAFIFPLAAEWS